MTRTAWCACALSFSQTQFYLEPRSTSTVPKGRGRYTNAYLCSSRDHVVALRDRVRLRWRTHRSHARIKPDPTRSTSPHTRQQHPHALSKPPSLFQPEFRRSTRRQIHVQVEIASVCDGANTVRTLRARQFQRAAARLILPRRRCASARRVPHCDAGSKTQPRSLFFDRAQKKCGASSHGGAFAAPGAAGWGGVGGVCRSAQWIREVLRVRLVFSAARADAGARIPPKRQCAMACCGRDLHGVGRVLRGARRVRVGTHAHCWMRGVALVRTVCAACL